MPSGLRELAQPRTKRGPTAWADMMMLAEEDVRYRHAPTLSLTKVSLTETSFRPPPIKDAFRRYITCAKVQLLEG
jgi:hypothetical protein